MASLTSCWIFHWLHTVRNESKFKRCRAVEEAVEKEGFEVRNIEGEDGGKWF